MRAFFRPFRLALLTALAPVCGLLAQHPPHASVVALGNLNTSNAPLPAGAGGGASTTTGVAYFAGWDMEHGTEVWRWSGSGSASLHADTRPGPESGRPSQFTSMGSMVIWVADDGVRGPEIRGSLPLPPSSALVDMQPGLSHPPPQILGASGGVVWFSTPAVQQSRAATALWAMAVFGSPVQVGVYERDSIQQTSTVPGQPHFFFIARPFGSPLKYDLCRVNGTQNAQSIENLDPAGTGATPPAGSYAATPGFVCYRHCSGGWPLRLLNFGSGTPVTLAPQSDATTLPWLVSNGTDRVCFAARTSAEGAELWTTLGTAATTTLLADAVTGPASGNPSRLLMSPGNPGVFFQIDAGAGRDLYFINPDEAPPTARQLRTGVQTSTQFALVDGDEIALDVPDNHIASVWLADGKTGTGQWVGEVFSSITRLWNPSTAVPPARQLNVLGATSAEGAELWRLNGTATLAVLALNPGGGSASPRGFFPWNDAQLCVADAPQGVLNFRVGTSGSPSLVPQALPPDVQGGNGSSHPAEFTDCGSLLLFTASDGNYRRLYMTKDGQMDSAAPVSGIYEPEQLVRFQDRVFMLGRSSVHATGTKQLYEAQTDGVTVTAAPYAGGTHSATALVAAAGRLFFVEPVTGGKELLQTMLPDFTLGEYGTFLQDASGTGITQMTPSSGHLYFSAQTAAAGAKRVLWATDGTTAGTRSPALDVEQPQLLGALGDACVFCREVASGQKFELFVWDGDDSENVAFQGYGPLADAPERHRLAGRPAGVELAGRFYYTSRKGSLWSTDGMGMQVTYAHPSLVVRAEGLAVLDDRLVFTAADTDNRLTLFTHTAAAGPAFLTTLPAQSLPCPFVRLGGSLWFTLAHLEFSQGGTDLWRTDGTQPGTLCAMRDVMTRETAYVPMGVFGSHLVLGATGPQYFRGIEPMLLNHDATVPASPTLTGARRGQAFSFTYADVVTGAVSDFDGDTLAPLRLRLWEGTLTRNGTAVDGSTDISPGDSFVWQPADAISGVVYPLEIYTADPWRESVGSVAIQVDTPLDVWAQGHFTADELADPAISGADADADGDGVANALEFVFGRHPRTHTSEPACTPTVADAPAGGGRVVRFTFVRAAVLAEGTVLTVESSPDLAPGSWQAVAAKTQNNPWTGSATVTEASLPDGRVQAVVELPAPGAGQAFMRLSVGL